MRRRRVCRFCVLGSMVAFILAACWWFVAAPAFSSFSEVRAAWRSSEGRLLDREEQLLQELRLDYSIRRLSWTPLAEMSPTLTQAIIHGEDRRFFRHHGVDWRAVAAVVRDRLRGRPLRGASTLTMQVAARLDPSLGAASGRRDAGRKLRQMRAAQALERRWSKEEILEAYCNLVDFRGELQGIATVSRAVFAKDASSLTEAESLMLAALLPSPGAGVERISARGCALAAAAGTPELCDAVRVLASSLTARPHAIEPAADLAPQLARRLLQRPGETVRTTLDAKLQRRVSELLGQSLLTLAERNVRDGAALVVENDSGAVLAYVGSAGAYSTAPLIDGVRARRQAGSTLKPFLYALALEQRYLTAASILDDSPLSLETAAGLYMPQNYERDHKGLVSLRTSLASSLNIPAVRTLMLVGVERFRDRLRDLGYHGLERMGEHYGWSLALGSADVSLWEQVSAYRALANGGLAGEPRLLAGAATGTGSRIMPADVSFIIADILADPAGRSLTFDMSGPLATRGWSAVKTGTSKDMRDNWCIGFNQEVTVGVWVGNFEGDSMREVSGVSGAAPVWHAVMGLLEEEKPGTPPLPPPAVVRQHVVFRPPVEPPREEWFLAGTTAKVVELSDPGRRSPRIDSPADGVVVALDPDIPSGHQVMHFRATSVQPDLVFELDGRVLGNAAAGLSWAPVPGSHRLRLLNAAGQELDRISFLVR